MGEQKARRAAFFAQHPYCCFCGGTVPATTEDHWPPRMIFRDRQWPEGFNFPACYECNHASSASEALLALLIHGAASDEDRRSYRKTISSIRSNYPGLIEEMLPQSSSEVRGILRAKGLEKPQGITLRELPIIKLDISRWQPVFDLFVAKMMMALHYQCFDTPLSPRGKMWYTLHTNVDLTAGQFFPNDFFEGMRGLAPRRNSKLLNDQFDLVWQCSVENRTGVWSFAFHNKIAFTGFSSEDPEALLVGHEKTMTILPWTKSGTTSSFES